MASVTEFPSQNGHIPCKSTARHHPKANGAYKPQLIDSLTAEQGALRYVLQTGDADKCATLKRNIGPEHFQDPDARAIAEVLWEQYEADAAIDFAAIAKVLSDRTQTSAFAALFALMPTPEREPDFRDCVHTVLNWKRAQSTLPAPQYETFTFKDMAALPRPQWLIRSLLVEKTTSVISADSGHFKSFVALEMALCVATGTPFHGREVRQGAAVYVAAEGFYTVYERAAAWAQERGCELPENFHILKVPINVSEAGTVQKFAEQIAALSPALVVLDTLSQCAIGLNENANNEMADFMRGMMVLASAIGAHVQAVHHNSKATGTFRGAGAIKANVDTHITLDRPDPELCIVFVRCEKQRGKPFDAFALDGSEVELPFADEYGEPITSLVFEVCGEAVTPKNEKNANAKKADRTRAALLEAFGRVAIDGAEFGGVKIGFWKEEVEKANPPICAERQFWKYRKALENDGTIRQCGSHNGSLLFERTAPTASTALSESAVDAVGPRNAEPKYCTALHSPFGSAVSAVGAAPEEQPDIFDDETMGAPIVALNGYGQM